VPSLPSSFIAGAESGFASESGADASSLELLLDEELAALFVFGVPLAFASPLFGSNSSGKGKSAAVLPDAGAGALGTVFVGAEGVADGAALAEFPDGSGSDGTPLRLGAEELEGVDPSVVSPGKGNFSVVLVLPGAGTELPHGKGTGATEHGAG
jgi:hypothetical protein